MTQEQRKQIEEILKNLKQTREDVKYLHAQKRVEVNLQAVESKLQREELDDLTAAWSKLGDAISYLTVLAGGSKTEKQEAARETTNKTAKRLRIRVEDAEDDEAQEFQADSLLLFLTEGFDKATKTCVVQNIQGTLHVIAIIQALEKNAANSFESVT